MSLDGAQLNFVNATGVSVAHAAKGREFKVGSYLGCDLVLPDAERVHCEIKCDAFGRVSIYNHSRNEPILLNDQVVHATAKRPLLHGARIRILNEVYTWNFPKSEELGTPDRTPPEQAANSSPSLKGNRQRRQFDNRLTVHNFRYSINSDDEGNTSIESRELETSTSSSSADISATAETETSITPPGKDADESEPKVDLLEATQNKENTSTLGNKMMLQLCARSDVVITSFSPRETGVKIEKSFTAVMKPTSGMGTATTPKSVYNTPKSVLSELNDDSCSRDLPEFSTPSTSKKALAGKRPTSMYLVDLTTPQRLRPTLSVTPKQTPGSAGVISVNSTDELSDSSVLVIDITNSSTPSTASVKQQQRRVINTPKEQLLAAGSTPKRTPQSLMKRALLTSAKKQLAANPRTPTTPLDATKRQSLLEARRQCLTAPRRLPFHPHPQWRTPGRRQIPAVNVKEPQTSPRKRPSLSLSSPRENKISKMRKTLAANAKISPNVGMSNKLVAKARRALNSPKQESPNARRSAYSPKPESPNRIGSPKLDTPKAKQPQSFELSESSTPERAENSNAELSLTFTIDDEQNATGPALEALVNDGDAANESQKLFLDSILERNESRQSKLNEVELKLNESSTKDSPQPSPKDAEACEERSKEILNLNEASDEESLNKTYDLNDSEAKASLELSKADVEQLSNTKVANECQVIDKNCAADKPSIQAEKSAESLTTDPINKSLSNAAAVNVIDDNICEEVPKTSTYQEDLVTITDVHLAEDTICEEVPTNEDTICEEVPTNEKDIFTSGAENAVGFTPRRSLRRSSIEVRKKHEQSLKPTRRASTSAVVESQRHVAVLVTPTRKRRLTEELPTTSRKSQRLLSNTPKKVLPVDESVGDMGVIIEEDPKSADNFPTETDEDYGTELQTKDTDEPDKIDYHGMRELLKTPKSCSTPHFKGLREMIRTPKEYPSAVLGNIEELLDASTPKRSVTISRVALELSKSETQDMYFKTPRGRDLMVPNDPASAVLKSVDKSLATTTEYDLNATNATLHLDKIFDDVLAVETTDPEVSVEDSENEINVTAISTAAVSETDPLSTSTTPTVEPSDTVRSEALMNISHAETSHKDPLTSTAFKKGGEMDLHQDALNDESYADRPESPGICDVSGIQMLDRTTDSMFSEPLVVTGVDSCDVTLEESKPAGMVTTTNKSNMLDEGSDTDSMVGLSEPLVLSDDETEVEEVVLDSQEQIEKSNASDSIIQLNDSQIDDELINNKKEDENEADVAKDSSVNEEKSIDLTEEESTMDNTQDKLASSKEQKNDQDAETTAAEPSCNQIDSQIESEFAIDLEASCLDTTTDECSAQAEVTKTSTIYGADLSLAAETQPADDSLIKVSSNIQDKDTNEQDSIIELDASNADNESSEIQLDRRVSAEADKVEDIPVEEDFKVQSVPDESDDNKQTSDVPETHKQPANSSAPEPDFHQKEVQEDAAVSTDEISAQNQAVQNIESINESQEKKTESGKETSENGDGNEQSSEQIEVKAINENVQLVDEIENESEVVIISGVSNATNDELVPQIVTKSAETKEVIADVELASESISVLDASVVAEEEVEEQAPSQSEIELKTQVDRETNKSVEHIKEQAVDESVIDLDAETEEEIITKSSEKSSNKLDNENKTQNDVEITNVDDSLVEMDASVVVILKSGEELADKQLSGKPLNVSDEEIQFADLEATREDDELQPTVETLSTSAEAETEAKLESTNVDESLVEIDASVVIETEKEEEHREQSAAETLPKPAEVLSTQDKIEDTTEADLESAHADESLVVMDASAVIETEKEEEHLGESFAETLPKSAEVLSTQDKIEDKTESDLESAHADESLVEMDASAVIETEREEEHLGESAAEALPKSTEVLSTQDKIEDKTEADLESAHADESLVEMDASVTDETEKKERRNEQILSTSAEILSNQDEIEDQPKTNKESTNAEESLVEIDASVVVETEKKEEDLSKEAATTLSTSLELPPNRNETVNKSQVEVECTNADESLVEIDASVAAETEKCEMDLESTNADESVVIETEKMEEKLNDEAVTTLSTSLEVPSEVELESTKAAQSMVLMDASVSAETEKGGADLKSTNADESLVEIDASAVIETEKEEEHLDQSAAETLQKSAEALSNQDKIDDKTEADLESTNADESLVEIDASIEVETDQQGNLNESPVQTLSTSLEVPSNQDNIENITQAEVESTSAARDVPETHKAEELVKEQATDDFVIDLDSETDEEEQFHDRLPESITKSPEKSSDKLNDENKTQDDVEATKVDNSLIELNASSEKGDEQLSVSAIPSTSAENPMSDPLDESNGKVEATSVDDSLVKLDASVVSQDKKENEHIEVPGTQSTSAENASGNEANDSLIQQNALGVAETDKSMVELDNRDSASTSAEIQDPQNANEAESRDKENLLSEISANVSEKAQSKAGVEKAEHDESKDVSDVMEPSTKVQEPETEQKSALNDSLVKNQDLNKQDDVAELSMTAEVKTKSGNEIMLDDISKNKITSPEVLSNKIEDNSAVIDLDASCVLEIQSVEANLKEKDVGLNTEEKQATVQVETAEFNASSVAKTNANTMDEAMDKTDQTETSKAPEEDSKSTEIVEPTTQIIECKVEDKNPAISMDKTPKKGPSRKPSTTEDFDTEPSEIKLTKRTRKPSVALELKETHVQTEDQNTNNVHKAEDDVAAVSSHAAKKLTAEIHSEKPKRRGRKPTAEVVEIEDKIEENVEQSIDLDKPKQQLQESPAENVDTEAPVEEKKDEHIDLVKPRQRGRKLAKVVEAEAKVEEKVEKAVDLEKQKGRGRKPSVEVVANAEHAGESKKIDDLDKPKRRGRGKPAVDVVETEAHVKESGDKTVELDKPKRRGQTPSGHVAETEAQCEEIKEITVDLDKPKRRLRKPSAEVVEAKQIEELNKPKRRGRKPSAEVAETEAHAEEKKEDTIEPKRRGRKSSADITQSEEHAEKNTEDKDTVDHDKPNRRLRKASADVPSAEPQHTEDVVEQIEEKPKRRYRRASTEVTDAVETVELPAKKASRSARKASAETVENDKTSKEHLSVIDEAGEPAEKRSRLGETAEVDAAEVDAADNDKRHGRKQSPSADVVPEEEPLAETVSAVVVKEVEPLSQPLQKIVETSEARVKGLTRRGRKATVDEEAPVIVEASVPDNKASTRRGHKATVDEEAPIIVEASVPDNKASTRRGRKATVDEEAPVIVEASVPDNKASTRRGRKATTDEEVPTVVEATVSHNKGSTRRGRKATADEEAPTIVEALGSELKSSTRRGRKATADEETPITQPVETAEVKPKRRGRNASADVAHAEVQPLATTEKPTRRARKPSVDVAAAAEPPAEKKNTRRARKPSTNVEITVEETPQPKKTTARRGRKASVSATADEVSKQFDIQTLPIQPIETATIVSGLLSPKRQVLSSEDELTPRRREGRNLPRKNYDETSDEDKPGSSRKARKRAAVTTPTQPAEPGTSPLPKPSTPLPSKSVEPAVEVHTPVAPIVLPDPTSSQKREGRNMPRKNYSETSDDDKPSTSRGRRVRQPTIKALEQLVDTAARPATPKRRAVKAKAAAKSADDHTEEPAVKKVAVEEAEAATPATVKRGGRKAKIVDEQGDQQPAPKKPRGGARAKTPAIVEVTKEQEVEEPKEVPATKRAMPARGRAARAVKVADEAEIVQETATPSRSGRGRKVHFETTEEVATAAKEDQPATAEAPKRATRSRRK
ncbi:hypothetical protein ACLKA6_007407 [Drosophila palustris]